MDYTGSSVYCQSQIDQVFDELRSQMFGNPHSANPSSSMTGDKVEEVRSRFGRQVCRFLSGHQMLMCSSFVTALTAGIMRAAVRCARRGLML